MKILPYFCYIKITTMEKFSFNTRCAINLILIEFITDSEDTEMSAVYNDLKNADTDELIGTHLLTPHLN